MFARSQSFVAIIWKATHRLEQGRKKIRRKKTRKRTHDLIRLFEMFLIFRYELANWETLNSEYLIGRIFRKLVQRKFPIHYERFGHTQKLTQSTSTTKDKIAGPNETSRYADRCVCVQVGDPGKMVCVHHFCDFIIAAGPLGTDGLQRWQCLSSLE